MNIPPGTTHIMPALETDFDQTPSYFKWGYNFTGPETGRMFCCWYHWYQGKWCKDLSFTDRHKRLQPV